MTSMRVETVDMPDGTKHYIVNVMALCGDMPPRKVQEHLDNVRNAVKLSNFCSQLRPKEYTIFVNAERGFTATKGEEISSAMDL